MTTTPSFAKSHINRDDTGSPKSAVYGGARRGRASSQATKRAIRVLFNNALPEHLRSVRTRRLHETLSDRFTVRHGVTQDLAERASTALVKGLKLTKGKREKELPYPLFFGIPQIDLAVDAAVSALKDSGLIGRESAEGIAAALADVHLDESLSEGHPVDVALFGRMVADLPRIKVDAAVQVAHALSTHEVTAEFDYFTTVDDMNPKEDTGAAMIDTVEFNSATYYRYATVGIHQLAANLSGSWSAAVDALDAFLEAFTLSVPSGHQNSFAHRTRPALVAVVLREDQPVNLVSAFEVPVYSHHGVVPCSIKRLADSFAAERDRWGDHPLAVFNSAASELLDNATQSALTGAFGPNLSFAELREGLRRVVAERA